VARSTILIATAPGWSRRSRSPGGSAAHRMPGPDYPPRTVVALEAVGSQDIHLRAPRQRMAELIDPRFPA